MGGTVRYIGAVTELIQDGDRTVGVNVREDEILVDDVILASGGFEASE